MLQKNIIITVAKLNKAFLVCQSNVIFTKAERVLDLQYTSICRLQLLQKKSSVSIGLQGCEMCKVIPLPSFMVTKLNIVSMPIIRLHILHVAVTFNCNFNEDCNDYDYEGRSKSGISLALLKLTFDYL